MATPRLILDTNLLVGAAYAPGSSSGRLLAAATAGTVRLIVSPATFAEYRFIVPRAVRRPGGVERVLAALRRAEAVVPTAEENAAARGVSEDPDDDKFLALAAAAGADALLSNDRHLLDVGEYAGVPIRRPGAWTRGEDGI
ncbi:putative toxin-antitoxin system toxin component, PIN family [Alienimonas californiensis]|uniref:PIN domain protein n=1 Tax=Alienimonas californiensis TaxID=2527989 RepID=A0A517P4S2_9PLAN|nr:putative toxin-antitoxin system toxin component, PIN family [Alienimonas californiensis]QDT14373.1 PIN domain protein [Alienimonas californiensis]